mmetsp:Transcript_119388/g.234583  ORF Transcript_119388/g.234583 Transcript_119388/m.234583 type:complete len:310 (-) Transcript_119388:44-973(-)|eukprot:CAMPEP_0170393990 /NCGR_PEP_ID=MMETSP0117_2-20130122/21021_1 /TAXON_ID=400756 /ORGANISM="Durinskia baltica, Strain CSIRO CS-38" /LENGTH=309 /DNA_ID=CAMNT_0010650233 /DNA_START=78 /DNA_END=1007 /DNA_ORIENTATION=-
MLGLLSAAVVAVIAALVFFKEQHEYFVHNSGIVLITGASTGIGRHAAEYLADNHNFLILAGVRKESDFSSIQNMNKSNLLPILIDVSSHESCEVAVEEIRKLSEQRRLPFVGLVNNAGVGMFNPLEFQDMGEIRRLFDTNVFGLLDLTQQTLPLLRASKGRIVMLSSVSGFVSSPFSGAYAASKYAVEALSDSLRRELVEHGVSVSVVQPGYVRTQIIASSVKASEEQYLERKSEMLSLYPGAAKRDGMEQMMAEQVGPDVTTTPAIEHALIAAYPKTRYPVAGAMGLSAKFISWMVWALSDRLEDTIK